jgi:hypothetical protein
MLTGDIRAASRIGDRSMPGLLSQFSKALGCPKSGNIQRDRCRLIYDMPSGEPPVSQMNRLVMRSQPALLKKLLSRTFQNGATFFASAGAAAT